MGIKVKAIERNINFGKGEENWQFVMQPELYGQLALEKVIAQAALNCGIPKPAMKAAVNGYCEVVKAWATEGHSIPIPGLGTMRFGLRSKAVAGVQDVKASLITSRHVIFTPNTDLKKELAETSVNITCYDRNGKIVKTVTSDDKNVEDTDDAKGDSGNNAGGSGNTADSGEQGAGGTSQGTGDNSGEDNEL